MLKQSCPLSASQIAVGVLEMLVRKKNKEFKDETLEEDVMDGHVLFNRLIAD